MARKLKPVTYSSTPDQADRNREYGKPRTKRLDDFGAPYAHGGAPKKGKAKTVLRDPAAYDRYNRRPKQS